jgi:hypothetical protein
MPHKKQVKENATLAEKSAFFVLLNDLKHK